MSPPSDSPQPEVLGLAVQPLTTDERRLVVEQARVMIEGAYVHLPLKQAMHAINSVQRLRLLELRLPRFSDRAFHDEMIAIFTELRDLHTNYVLPEPYASRVAYLPFRIEHYREDGVRHYVVTRVVPGAQLPPPFGPGAEVTHWNGVPIDRAVELNGERNAGSNEDARHARGLESLTQRWMGMLAAPDEEWVTLGFLANGTPHEQRFDWQIFELPPEPSGAAPGVGEDPIGAALGLDLLVEQTRRAQKALLVPEAVELEREMAADRDARADDLTKVSAMPDVFQFRTVTGPKGDIGYLRIRTFMAPLREFVEEALRIVDLLPDDGLILDVRGNGGGVIACGEMLLQLFTPGPIEPESLCFINTRLMFELTAADPSFGPWHESMAEAVETGAQYSDLKPLAPNYREMCNSIGQRYHGPVALITDALCYSTTDIFSAGFQDHGIGPVIGVSGNTGAGGANVWGYDVLEQLLPGVFRPLPKGISMRVAVRRTARVGERSGDPVEDLGVKPDLEHPLTKRDLLEENADLIAFAAQALNSPPG